MVSPRPSALGPVDRWERFLNSGFCSLLPPLPRHPDKNPGSSEDACALIGHTVPCNEAAEEMFIRISKANDACVKPLPAAGTYPTTRTSQSSWRELP